MSGGRTSDLRVLMPYRLDFFARSMDSTIATMWLALRDVCDVHFWGPGFAGYDPARTLDDVARTVDPDVVLLPDLHHAMPGLWTSLLEGVNRIDRPVVQFMSDPGSAVEARRAQLREVRPAAVLGLGPGRSYELHADLCAELGIELLLRPLGHDPDLFWTPSVEAEAERDIDVLVCGALGGTAYPVRQRVQQAARSLAGGASVCDLVHPGYWESIATAPRRRGQAAFADLLRRSRLVVTGTTYEILSAKYYEVAASGAVGVGDLPAQAGADDLRGAMLEVGVDDEVDAIAHAIAELLADHDRLAGMRRTGLAAASRFDVTARARLTVALLERVAGGARRGARARGAPDDPIARSDAHDVDVDVVRVCAPVDADAPTTRRDWHDVRGDDRVDALRRLLTASSAGTCVLAFDPDAAAPAEALLLAQQAREAGGIALRSAVDAPDPLERGFCCVAVDRSRLLAALHDDDGVAGIETAVWRVMADMPTVALTPPGFDTVDSQAMRLRGAVHAGVPGAAEAAQPRLATPLLDGARFEVLDPGDEAHLARIAQLAREGHDAAPVELGVPVRCGVSVEEAGLALLARLEQDQIDLDSCTDLVILERPLAEVELDWLADRARAPAQ